MPIENIQFDSSIQRLVVFDTNAYLNLVHNVDLHGAQIRANALVELERAAGIQALASATVLAELLSHLADPTRPEYEVRKRAVVAAVEHCSMTLEDGTRHPAIRASPEHELCIVLWNTRPERLLYADDLARAMAKRVAENPTEHALDAFRDDLATVARHMKAQEHEFGRAMQRFLLARTMEKVRELAPDTPQSEFRRAYLDYLESSTALEAIANTYVKRCHKYVEVDTPETTLAEMSVFVAEKFSTAMRLFCNAVYKVVDSAWDMTRGKGPNLIWDLQIAFMVGENTVAGRPTSVVTGDQDIVNAAADCGFSDSILGYSEYRKRLASREC